MNRSSDLLRRRDILTSIVVQVGISLSVHRGLQCAVQFLLFRRIEHEVAMRVIFESEKRREHQVEVLRWDDSG